MRIKIKSIAKRYFDPAMLRWGSVGATTFVIDYLLFIFLFGITKSVVLSNLISTSIATFFNYYTHHRWTFKSDQTHAKSTLKYLLNLVFWWFISTSIIKLLVVSNIDPKLAKIAPFIFIVPINFFVLNKIVFKKRS
jgi:putative flippase GtrA